MNKRNPNITCEFTEADWEWWYKKEQKLKIRLSKKYKCPKCNLITEKGALTTHYKFVHGGIHNKYLFLGNLKEMMCVICDNPNIDFYNIMKIFCSDMEKIKKNICNNHLNKLYELGQDFLHKK